MGFLYVTIYVRNMDERIIKLKLCHIEFLYYFLQNQNIPYQPEKGYSTEIIEILRRQLIPDETK